MSAESGGRSVEQLEAEIRRHRDLYYNRQPEITDAEFDALVDELREIAPSSEVLAEVGAPVDTAAVGLPTKRHRIPMGSLDKVPEDRLDAWAEKAGPTFLVQEKYDGISLEIEYDDGGLVDAITRGDGYVGEVVTHNAVAFHNVHRTLPRAFSGSVRGEVMLRLSVFEAHFARLGFANPRNTVSGTVRKKHGDLSLARHFEVFFYDVIADDVSFTTETEKLRFLAEDLGLRPAVSYFDVTIDEVRRIYREYLGDEDTPGKRLELDYEIDGLVVRASSIETQQRLGVVQNRPRFATAYKFPSEGKTTVLEAVDWSLGIGSRVTPVARLRPSRIAGVTVSNATLHNIDIIRELGIRIGDEVYVERRGDVIPQVRRVVASHGGEVPQPPDTCPACGHDLDLDGKYLVCPHASCPGKAFGDIFKWVQELEVDSLGEKWIRILLDEGLIGDPVDLYTLRPERLLPLDRMGQKLATKIVENIAATRSPPLDRFLAGLNIPGFSRQRAQMLIASGTTTIDGMLALSAEEIASVKGFGDVLGPAVASGLALRAERIARLRAVGVEPREAAPPSPDGSGDGPLAGRSFCFTGAVERPDPETGKRYTRKRLQELVVERGGRAMTSVSSSLDYLVLADPASTSTKARKARELGVELLSEEAFFALLGEADAGGG